MTDVLTKEQRRKNMQRIRAKDTKIEVVLRKALWGQGIRYRKNYSCLPGKPDIAITKYRIAVFCDSEYFHGKNWESLKERIEKGDNSEFWIRKIEKNVEHDNEVNKQLFALGWSVIRLWGKDILNRTDDCVKAIKETINENKNMIDSF